MRLCLRVQVGDGAWKSIVSTVALSHANPLGLWPQPPPKRASTCERGRPSRSSLTSMALAPLSWAMSAEATRLQYFPDSSGVFLWGSLTAAWTSKRYVFPLYGQGSYAVMLIPHG